MLASTCRLPPVDSGKRNLGTEALDERVIQYRVRSRPSLTGRGGASWQRNGAGAAGSRNPSGYRWYARRRYLVTRSPRTGGDNQVNDTTWRTCQPCWEWPACADNRSGALLHLGGSPAPSQAAGSVASVIPSGSPLPPLQDLQVARALGFYGSLLHSYARADGTARGQRPDRDITFQQPAARRRD